MNTRMAIENPPPAEKPSNAKVLSRAIGVALAISSVSTFAQEAPASSQDAKPSPPPEGKKAHVTQLERIEVTADYEDSSSPKFTAPLVDTPMSVTILPQSVMQDSAAASLQDALRNIPGITFAAGEGGTPTGDLPSIRGFNSSGNVYVDGLRDIGVQTRDIFDLEQIEVIKGPDSSISGRSGGGGSLNLVSKTAQAEDFIETTGTYGSAGQYRATLDGNLKISEGIAARLNIMDVGGGVPGRDSAVRADKWGIAPTITFGLQSSTRAILNYYHFEDRSTPDYGVPADFFDTGKPLVETQGIDRKNFYGLANRDFRHNPVDSSQLRVEHDFNNGFSLRSQVRYTASKNDYVLTLPYLAQDDDGAPTGMVYRLPIGNSDRTRVWISSTDLSGHFATGRIQHDIDVGFEISHEKERLLGGGSWIGYDVESSAGAQGFGGGDCFDPALLASYDCTSLFNPDPRDPWQGTITPNTSEIATFTTRDWAPYAFDTITLTPHWKINAGLRWDKYHTEASDPANPTNWGGTDDMSLTSYQLSLMFKPRDNGTIYVTTSSAAIPETQAGSGSGQDQAYPTVPDAYQGTIGLKPEKTRTVELGTKWKLFSDQLLLSGDVFDERHIHAGIEVTPDTFAQVGKTRVRGVEVSANGSITETLNIIAGYSHLDAKVLAGAYYDEVGKQLPNTPPNTFSLWSTYRVIPAVTVGAGAYYRDRQIGYAGPPDEYIGSYTRVDSMAKWQVNPHLALQANVQNLFDTHYYAKSFYWYALPAPGRTWMLTADLRL